MKSATLTDLADMGWKWNFGSGPTSFSNRTEHQVNAGEVYLIVEVPGLPESRDIEEGPRFFIKARDSASFDDLLDGLIKKVAVEAQKRKAEKYSQMVYASNQHAEACATYDSVVDFAKHSRGLTEKYIFPS